MKSFIWLGYYCGFALVGGGMVGAVGALFAGDVARALDAMLTVAIGVFCLGITYCVPRALRAIGRAISRRMPWADA